MTLTEKKEIMTLQEINKSKYLKMSDRVFIYSQLSEEFINENEDKLDWRVIQELIFTYTNEFIENNKDKFDWEYITRHQNLSESFIRKHIDKLSFYYISRYQDLSLEFIIEFKENFKKGDLETGFQFNFTQKIYDKLIDAPQEIRDYFEYEIGELEFYRDEY